MRLKYGSLFVVLLIGCPSGEQQFPTIPPNVERRGLERLRHVLAERAGVAATDCGEVGGVDDANASRCAERCFRADRPFYVTATLDASPWSARLGGSFPTDRARYRGYVATRNGAVSAVALTPEGDFTTEIFRKHSTQQPLRLGGIVRSGVLRDAPLTHTRAVPAVSGIVIVEAVVAESGTVLATRVVKALPGTATKLAERIVQRAEFEPATVFGHPVSAFHKVSVNVTEGVVVGPVRSNAR